MLSLILEYVDDILIACQTQDLAKVKNGISNVFECIDKGPLNHFLGMEIEREGDLGAISLGHSQYIKDLLGTPGSENCTMAKTPLYEGFQIDCTSDQCKNVEPAVYQSVIGELVWLTITTRPDILHSVSEHMTAIKHMFRYFSAPVDMKLHYKQCGQPFFGFVDADWAGDRIDRKSYSAFGKTTKRGT